MIRKIIIACQLLSFSLFTHAAQKHLVTIYGDASYRPYSWEEAGEFKGIYVDILTRAFVQMPDYQVSLLPVPWRRGLNMLDTGRAFALFPPYYYPNHRPYIQPYSTAIFTEKTILVCNKKINSAKRDAWPEDYYGLTIGQSSGFLLGGEAFLEAVKNKKIKMTESLRAEQNLLMVGTGRIDCYVNDELAIKTELKRIKASFDSFNVLDSIDAGKIVSFENSYLGFTNINEGKYPYKQDFIAQFNQIIDAMKRNGEIDDIINKYLESTQ